MTSEMLRIETCAKQGDRFIPISDVGVLKLRDPHYVDGSVRVTIWGKPLITDAYWTDIVLWWASLSNVLHDLTHGTTQTVDPGFPDMPVSMLFEVAGDNLTWSVGGSRASTATVDRVAALRILMREYRLFFERMKVINPPCISDYDVALDYMSRFKAL